MRDAANMGNVPGMPVEEVPNQMPSNDQSHNSESTEAIPIPQPGTSAPPANDANSNDDRNPSNSTPTGLRDFEGRRLYFANVCSTVSPHALHCIFRSYGLIRTFHYDTTLHYGYVVYMEREHALLARYGVDGLILGSRAIRVYYPPFKPRHPTRYCYNCREMGHFIQSCPYTQCNNWEYNYSQLYNQGQPVMDHMNHPSSPMMHHYAGHMIPPSQFMFPTAPVSPIPGQPPGAATLMYQPGWPGAPAPAANMPFMSPFMNSGHQPMNPGHPSMPPMPPHNPVVQHQMHLNHQLMNQVQNAQPVPPMVAMSNSMPTAQPLMHSAPPLTPSTIQPSSSFPVVQQAHSQLHPNINAMIQEQATAVIQQHLTPMVQQVVNQIMQDPVMNNLQHSMIQHQNMEPSALQSSAYTINEVPESASVQSGSMTMQHGSYTTMEEPRNTTMPQNILAQLMQNLPMQNSDSEYVDLSKMMQFAARALLQDQYGQRNEDPYLKENGASRPQCIHEMEEDMSPRQPNENCCPVHNTPLTKVKKTENAISQQPTATKTTTIHNGSTTTPKPQEDAAENIIPMDQSFQTQTRNTSSTESRPNTAEQPIQAADNQYYSQYPYQPPFSLPSSIFFTLPPIVVNITSPGPFMSPTESTTEPKATFPPPYDTIPKNYSDNYEFMQESERTLQEFEEVVQDDEQNYIENDRDLRAEQSNMITAQFSGMSVQPEAQDDSIEYIPQPIQKNPPIKPQHSKRIMKIVRGQEQTENGTEEAIMVYEQSPVISEREKQQQDRLKLRAMLMDGNEQDILAENGAAMIPISVVTQLSEEPSNERKLIYSELISTMNSSCNEIENLFTNLSSLVGNPLAKKCLDQIRTKSETDILKLSQQLLHKISDKDKPSDKEEIIKLSGDLMKYANQKIPSASEEPNCEGAVGGIRNAEEIMESSRSECDSRKDDSDDANNKRKNQWKKNKKRRR